MKKMIFTLTLLTMPALSISAAAEDYWCAWRGADMNGIAESATPPVKWSESENIKWKAPLAGDGSDSSPVIWEDKLIFLNAEQAEGDAYQFKVICLNRKDGKQIWEKTVTKTVPHEGHHKDHGHASYTPVTDGKLIWADFGSRGVYCLDMDGNIKWGRDLGQFNIRARFGEGNAPALVGDHLIILKDHEGQSFITALDKDTGETVWKKNRVEITAWTSPLPVEVDGKAQVVVAGTKNTIAYDAESGDTVWRCGGQTANVIPTPVTGLGMVFCTSGFRGAMMQAIKLGRTGDLTGTDAIAWEAKEDCPYVPSPLLYGDKLYFISGITNKLSCYNAKTGEAFYKAQPLDEINGVYASITGAGGRVYVVGRNGTTYVLKNAESLEIESINKLDDGIDCTPAFYKDEIYLKGKKNLYCIAEK